MKRKLLPFSLLLCCMVVGLGSTFQPENRAWEYRFEWHLSIESANKLGAEGWELVTTAREGGNSPVQYIFKRPR